jgi:MOSC domain-containing protein YiiM
MTARQGGGVLICIPSLGRGACFGSYAQVLAPGTVTVGDPADVSS